MKKEDVKSKKDFTVSTKAAHPEKSRITLMDVDPYWLHAYWEITRKDKTRILKKSDISSHPYKKIIRVYDISYTHFDGNNAHSYFDIEIDTIRGNWYINLWNPCKSLCAEIGLRSFEGDFYPIARSNTIDTPTPYQSSSGSEQWMRVTGDYKAVSLLPKKTQIEKTEPKNRVMENEIKDYYRKLRSGGRQQNKKSKTPFAEIHVTYGSDIRWEKEATKSAHRERKKTITPEMIKKKTPSKMGLSSLNQEEGLKSQS